MSRSTLVALGLVVALVAVGVSARVEGQRAPAPVQDAIAEAQAPPAGAPAPLPQDRGDKFDASKAEPSSTVLEGQPEKGQIDGLRLRPRPAERQEADADVRGDHEGRRRRQAQGDGGAAQAARDAATTSTPKLDPDGEDVARQAAAGRADRAAGRGHDLGRAGRDDARRDQEARRSSPTRRCRTRSTSPAGRSSRRCRSRCSRGWSGSTSTSTCPRRSCPSSRRPSSCRTGPSWATSRAARWSRSTTSTGCSRTSSRRCSSTACGCC